jgi:hypothetical protein
VCVCESERVRERQGKKREHRAVRPAEAMAEVTSPLPKGVYRALFTCAARTEAMGSLGLLVDHTFTVWSKPLGAAVANSPGVA